MVSLTDTTTAVISREQALFESAIAETRAHVARRLVEALAPVSAAADAVDLDWLGAFAARFADRSAHHRDIDYICHRALAAADRVESYSYAISPPFKDNDERAIYRAAVKLGFVDAGESLAGFISAHGHPNTAHGGPSKAALLEWSERTTWPDRLAAMREQVFSSASKH